MRVYLFRVNKALEVLADGPDVLSQFLHEELGGVDLRVVLAVELDDVGVVEVADLLETGLEDVPPHVLVDLAEQLQLVDYLLADAVHVQLVETLAQQPLVQRAER